MLWNHFHLINSLIIYTYWMCFERVIFLSSLRFIWFFPSIWLHALKAIAFFSFFRPSPSSSSAFGFLKFSFQTSRKTQNICAAFTVLCNTIFNLVSFNLDWNCLSWASCIFHCNVMLCFFIKIEKISHAKGKQNFVHFIATISNFMWIEQIWWTEDKSVLCFSSSKYGVVVCDVRWNENKSQKRIIERSCFDFHEIHHTNSHAALSSEKPYVIDIFGVLTVMRSYFSFFCTNMSWFRSMQLKIQCPKRINYMQNRSCTLDTLPILKRSNMLSRISFLSSHFFFIDKVALFCFSFSLSSIVLCLSFVARLAGLVCRFLAWQHNFREL